MKRELMAEEPTAAPKRDLMEIHPTGTPPGQDPEAFMADALDQESVSPEEQEQYDKFVLRAVQFIDGEKTQKEVLRMLNQPDVPVHEAVGKTAARITQLIKKSADDAGAEIGPDVIYHAGEQIVAVLMETGTASGVLPLEPESEEYQDALDMAFLEGVKAYGEDLLKGPEGKKLSAEAGDYYASQVAKEADAGQIDPAFTEAMQAQGQPQMNPVAAGVKGAINGQ